MCAIDVEISAWKICRELRDASVQLGTRRLKMLVQIAPSEMMRVFESRIAAGGARGHHLVVCGLQFAQIPLRAALAVYFYQTLAAFCSAALKLIRIGQEGCQRLLYGCLTNAEHAIDRSLEVKCEETGWFNPLLEIASMRHERAFERLFIS